MFKHIFECSEHGIMTVNSGLKNAPEVKFCDVCGKEMRLIGSTSKELMNNSGVKTKAKPIEQSQELEVEDMPIVFMKENKLIDFGITINEGEFIQDFEESKALGEPFVVMNNGLGVKHYFRKGKEENGLTELIPLSKKELRELNIEETVNQNIFGYFEGEI